MPRIIEIGFLPLLKRFYPEQVRYFDTRFTYADYRGYAYKDGTRVSKLSDLFRNAWDLWLLSGKKDYDFVVARAMGPINSEGRWSRYLAKKVMGVFLKYLILRVSRGKKLVVIDYTDHRSIHPRDLCLLKHSVLYFKRELADNIWSSLEGTIPEGTNLGSISHTEEMARHAQKLRPISLGIEAAEEGLRTAEKKYDVFYSAHNYQIHPARLKAEEAIKRLEEKGLRVAPHDHWLSDEEFKEVVSQTWLCLSPSGIGWDCYRHYEVAVYGSLPVLTPPSITCHKPYTHGENAYFLNPNEDWTERLIGWLQDKDKLREMTGRAYQHASTHHTFAALSAYLMREIESHRQTQK